MNARLMDELRDTLVAMPILFTQELCELEQQFPAQHFIPMHVCHILELWLHWESERFADIRTVAGIIPRVGWCSESIDTGKKAEAHVPH